jgi:hypothetical protein
MGLPHFLKELTPRVSYVYAFLRLQNSAVTVFQLFSAAFNMHNEYHKLTFTSNYKLARRRATTLALMLALLRKHCGALLSQLCCHIMDLFRCISS